MKSMKNIKEIRVQSKEASKKTEQILKDSKNKRCIWPGCNETQFMTVSMPVMIKTPEGRLIEKEPKIGVGAPACNYHFAIMSAGLCASVETAPGQYGLMAPVDMVKAAEAVVSGLIFSGRLQKLLKAKEQSLNKGGESNEHKPDNDKAKADQPKDNNRDKQRSESEQGKGGDPKPQDN